VGLVRGQRRDTAIWCVDVEKGSRAMRGLHVDVLGPVIVGRSPSSDIVIDEPYVSATHARFTIQGPRPCARGSGLHQRDHGQRPRHRPARNPSRR
jgi:hypothetical protein